MRSRKSNFETGHVITEKREPLETANERTAARKKEKQKGVFRIILTVILFLGVAAALVFTYFAVVPNNNDRELLGPKTPSDAKKYVPTIEIIDEDMAAGGEITSRMSEYIGQAESDFKDLGYKPVKAVIPTGSIREVDFYLEGYSGYIKMLIDRGTAVSVEDADRMLRYLTAIAVSDFQYVDVRTEGRAFWK